MKIILLRHGAPDFAASWLRTADDVKTALESYAHSRVTSTPLDQPLENLSSVSVCVSSNLARAIDSAALTGYKDCDKLDLFNESEIPHPNSLYLPLPWGLFLLIYRLLWFFGFKNNCPGKVQDLVRAHEGSMYLANLATKNSVVLLVGHGIMNRLICSELKNSGWEIDSKCGDGYWSTISLSCQ